MSFTNENVITSFLIKGNYYFSCLIFLKRKMGVERGTILDI